MPRQSLEKIKELKSKRTALKKLIDDFNRSAMAIDECLEEAKYLLSTKLNDEERKVIKENQTQLEQQKKENTGFLPKFRDLQAELVTITQEITVLETNKK